MRVASAQRPPRWAQLPFPDSRGATLKPSPTHPSATAHPQAWPCSGAQLLMWASSWS